MPTCITAPLRRCPNCPGHPCGECSASVLCLQRTHHAHKPWSSSENPLHALCQEVGLRSVAVRVYVVDLEEGRSQAATPRARSWDQVTCMSMPCSASEEGELCSLSLPPPWGL